MKKFRVLFAIFLVFSVFFTCFYGGKKISAKKIVSESESYQGVLTLWQVDSFEGGVGSRKQFLLKVAREFEKIYNGVLVMVVNMTKDSVEENYKNGIYPDIISYGAGINVENMSVLKTDNVVDGGMVGNKALATAWCRGGYALITNPNCKQTENSDKIIVSQGEYTCPLVNFSLDSTINNDFELLPPMDAYVKFVAGKNKYLVGTQRDVNRLERRGIEVIVQPLTEYNDLYQYVSICSTNQAKRFYAEEFINYLTSEKVQEQLKNIGMFSPFYTVEYENEHLTSMQSASGFATISAFTPYQTIKQLQNLSLIAINGDEQAKIKIKNMLI